MFVHQPILQQKPSIITTDEYIVQPTTRKTPYIVQNSRNFLKMNNLASNEFNNIMNGKPWTRERGLPLFILFLYICLLIIIFNVSF